MIDTDNDKRIVLTLDAGGTNFVFSALQGNKEIAGPMTLPSNADNLDKCLHTIIHGFEFLEKEINRKPDAISFAFPGPADYDQGIIGDLPNFEAFKGGVPMGPMLEQKFKVPVFINNDGNLYAYGEALSGILPDVNKKLKDAGSILQHRNLVGVTLGTGFGCGIVLNQELIVGDNSCGAEIHNTLNKYNPNWNAEESVSTRAIQRIYAERAGLEFNPGLMPKDIYNIAKRKVAGNYEAAQEAFYVYGENLGSSIANVVTLVDGLVAIGGGIIAAANLFAPAMFKELNRQLEDLMGKKNNRLSFKVFDIDNPLTFDSYAKGKVVDLKVPGYDKKVKYDSMPRIGVGFTKLGASKATSLGAYAYALQKMT